MFIGLFTMEGYIVQSNLFYIRLENLMKKLFILSLTIFIFSISRLGHTSSHCDFFDTDCRDSQSLNPKMVVKHYNPDLAFNGTTMFGLNKKTGEKAIIEVDMQGNIVWEYVLPSDVAGGKKIA